MEFRATQFSEGMLAAYSNLFRICFPGASGLTATYLKWLYADNPAGNVVGFDAWEGDELAAHYVCIPAEAVVHGVARRVLLSLNTATHPKFQGKGLFTKLAALTYERAAAEGFHAVYGVANDNSTPGFLRKLGFSLVSPLDAKIGIGNISSQYGDRQASDFSFRRIWNDDNLAWRIANPVRRYQIAPCGNALVGAWAPTGKPLLSAWAEVPADGLGKLAEGSGGGAPLFRLHLGLRPAGTRAGSMWVDIPKRFRPSPLNLIFLGLNEGSHAIEREGVELGQLDFDAF
ncbi:GNAT family N-acetyltransferase [Stenotrophomonas sp. ATCM1_4]|nr:GNAT family N-acetyltransferase [Stenotrophomonas sp. ATCM1_4]